MIWLELGILAILCAIFGWWGLAAYAILWFLFAE